MSYRSSKIRYTSSPIIKWIRENLAGRELNDQLRFQDTVSPRPGPAANLPLGVNHGLSQNFYYTRDGRRQAFPPTQLPVNSQKLLTSSTESSSSGTTNDYKKGGPTPGRMYWK